MLLVPLGSGLLIPLQNCGDHSRMTAIFGQRSAAGSQTLTSPRRPYLLITVARVDGLADVAARMSDVFGHPPYCCDLLRYFGHHIVERLILVYDGNFDVRMVVGEERLSSRGLRQGARHGHGKSLTFHALENRTPDIMNCISKETACVE